VRHAGARLDAPLEPAAGCRRRRGKLLNVRDATASQISDNAEIQNIKQILGLQHGKVRAARALPAPAHALPPSWLLDCAPPRHPKFLPSPSPLLHLPSPPLLHLPTQVYEDTKALRYGHLMIMTDQDHDGSHIKGLIMNFLHHFYPSLLKIPGFLVEFITPIIKVGRPARHPACSLPPRHPRRPCWHLLHAAQRSHRPAPCSPHCLPPCRTPCRPARGARS
jgi:hypothetical protein